MNEASEQAKALAEKFHNTYERLAPDFGYETREDTKQFDPESPNGRLMIAVCKEVIDADDWARAHTLQAENDRLNRALMMAEIEMQELREDHFG